MAAMTKQALRQICKDHKLYMTPHLNDKLYCNFKGFGSIGELEEYVNLRALFLEGNAIDSLEGLPPLPQLKCLYLQQNMLTSLRGLGNLPVLNTLDISNNHLTSLEHIQSVASLHTLLATNNQLESAEAIAPLAACTSLESLDLQNNRIRDTSALETLRALPQLKCLYLTGNPLVSALSNYRKTVIAAIPTLSYLDDRPVFERERRCAEAWARGGLEAERAENALCIQEEQERERRNFEALQRVREEGFCKRRERLGLPPGTTDPFMDTVDDSEWQFDEEPEELRAARERLAAYTAAVAGGTRQYDEALPDLVEGGSGQCSYAPAGVDEDVKAVLEDHAASVAELINASKLGLGDQPEENSNPNSAPSAAVAVPPAAAAPLREQSRACACHSPEKQQGPHIEVPVPPAKVTVMVGPSPSSGGSGEGSGAVPADASSAEIGATDPPARHAAGQGEGEEVDSDDDQGEAQHEEQLLDVGAGTLAAMGATEFLSSVAELASVVAGERAESEAGSDSVASEELADLDELD